MESVLRSGSQEDGVTSREVGDAGAVALRVGEGRSFEPHLPSPRDPRERQRCEAGPDGVGISQRPLDWTHRDGAAVPAWRIVPRRAAMGGRFPAPRPRL